MIEDVDDQKISGKLDNQAMMLIISAIDEKSMASFLNYRTSTTMLQRLSMVHEQSVRENKHILQQHFFNLAMKPS
jgi:hypothetical protein